MFDSIREQYNQKNKVDGTEEDAWKNAVSIPLQIALGAKTNATAKALWDDENLYVLVNVENSVLNSASADAYKQDSVEVFIDENNGKTDSYEADDKQYRINYKNEQSFNGEKCKAENVSSAAKETEKGYVIEAAFKWTDLKPAEGKLVGLEFQINDADASGDRIGTFSWYDESGNGWSSPAVFGTVALAAAKADTPAPSSGGSSTGGYTPAPSPGYTPTPSSGTTPSSASGTTDTTAKPADGSASGTTDTTTTPADTPASGTTDTPAATEDGSASKTDKTTTTTVKLTKVTSVKVKLKQAVTLDSRRQHRPSYAAFFFTAQSRSLRRGSAQFLRSPPRLRS